MQETRIQNKSRNIRQLAGSISSVFYAQITLGFPPTMHIKSCERYRHPQGKKNRWFLSVSEAEWTISRGSPERGTERADTVVVTAPHAHREDT